MQLYIRKEQDCIMKLLLAAVESCKQCVVLSSKPLNQLMAADSKSTGHGCCWITEVGGYKFLFKHKCKYSLSNVFKNELHRLWERQPY